MVNKVTAKQNFKLLHGPQTVKPIHRNHIRDQYSYIYTNILDEILEWYN